ncbi:hypothetical protein ACFFX0_25465 [Citricoccus parietis]|uniref:Uncharacterized protein n=1 Tax=Citricoccus parietis TaxID=592307 RepID=A0ABV5G646_9MICC
MRRHRRTFEGMTAVSHCPRSPQRPGDLRPRNLSISASLHCELQTDPARLPPGQVHHVMPTIYAPLGPLIH